MAGLGSIVTAFQRTSIDSPTSNTSSATMSTSMSHSSHSRTNSSHSHFGNGTIDWEGSKHGSVDTLNISIPDEFEFAERYSRLVDLEKVPWNEQLVGRVLRNSEKVCQLVDRIPQSVVQRLSFLIQRPFVRIVREVKRLSVVYAKCTKHEIQTAVKLVMAPSLADACVSTAVKALSLYQMSSEQMRRGKTARAGLTFPIGRFFRWLVEARISSRVEDHAALYLAASMEALTSELFFRACAPYFEKTDGELTQAVLDYGIANEAELWGILQPYQHLICGRNSSGTVIMPNHDPNNSSCSMKREDPLEMSRLLEQSFMVTCVGSIAELGDLVDRAMHLHQGRTRVITSPKKSNSISWSPDALRTLFHFMRCNELEFQDDRPSVQLTPERPYVVLPPLMEWIRVATTHCEHRHSSVVDSDDVRQAARLLLPGIDTPVRSLRTDESLCSSRHLDAAQSTAQFQQDLGFRMLACGRTDLVPNAAAMLGPDGIDTISEQGMTALMLACARGDEAMVQILLDNGAKPNLTVPSNSQKYPCIHPTIRHWTALSFAVAHRHTSVAQLLLDAGANVEGGPGENYTHSPLQLASAAGYHELVCLLLDKGADPYLTTLHRNGITSRGHGNSFALAAAHGHRNILRKLLEQPRLIRSSDILSLEEILAEGSDGPKDRKAKKARKNKIANMLQEAMYHSCEHGYLDIAMELRSMGVSWTFHCWLETLRTAKYFYRLAIIQCLFRDFGSIPIEEDYEELIREGLPLMFDIFRQSKNELVSKQLANVFPLLMDTEKIKEIPAPDAMHGARIDPQYINNPEMSDVTFVVEGRRFYAHKIVLVTASKRFKAMLSDRMQDPQKPVVEITEFSYHIFQLVMQYLYHGSTENLHFKSADLPELMSAANHFVLTGLQLHCERLLSHDLAWDNATTIYRQARLYGAESLLDYCHSFFLLNMPELLAKNETFKKLIFPPKPHPYDLPSMLQDTLAKRIFNRFTKQTTV